MKFKHKRDQMFFSMLHPALIMIFADLAYYAQSTHNIDLIVTDTVSTLGEDMKLGRVSPAHREHRAIDIRTKDLDVFVVQDLVNYINNKKDYHRFHYVSRSGLKRLAYYHTHRGEHIHLAIHSQFKRNYQDN